MSSESPEQAVPLIALGRVALEDAKRFRRVCRQIQCAVLAVGLLTVAVQSLPNLIEATGGWAWIPKATSIVTYLCAVLGIILQVGHWIFHRTASNRHTLGSTIKRRAMLIDALGPSSEQLDIRLLRQQVGESIERRARSFKIPEDYYASDEEHGLERLRHNLQESAFFTHSLYKMASAGAFWKFGLSAFGIAVGLLIIIPFAPREGAMIVANSTIAFIAFLVSADFLGQALDWAEGASVVERIERRLEKITPGNTDAYMAAFADYECATAIFPAPPTALYERERDRLDSLWRDRTGQ